MTRLVERSSYTNVLAITAIVLLTTFASAQPRVKEAGSANTATGAPASEPLWRFPTHG